MRALLFIAGVLRDLGIAVTCGVAVGALLYVIHRAVPL